MDGTTQSDTIDLTAPSGQVLKVETWTDVARDDQFDRVVSDLDHVMGLALASNYEYPSRYSIWNFGFTNPVLMFQATDRSFRIKMLSERGRGLVAYLHDVLRAQDDVTVEDLDDAGFAGTVAALPADADFAEEDRTRKLSVFTVVRAMWQALQHTDLGDFGLYGAFGYDLVLDFEDIAKKMSRAEDQRDVVLFVPDRIFKSTVGSEVGFVTSYEFTYNGHVSAAHPRVAVPAPFKLNPNGWKDIRCDHAPGEYEAVVDRARGEFLAGNLFEVVPGQCFTTALRSPPATVFRRLMKTNPSPFAFLMNLDDEEFLIGASPEMFLRSSGRQIETCPISGTITRGADALEDAEQVFKLLASSKEEAELTMCTDVDRNDKARICVPGSIEVRGRRQIEFYSRVIHTVDHVVGELADGYDGLDAFISHMWAVTVTGAPKAWAIKFLEANEKSPRRWYAGALGGLTAEGAVNTALSIRMVQVKNGIASVRAGATTLYYSDPAAEERETRLKASAFLSALIEEDDSSNGREFARAAKQEKASAGYQPRGLNILMVDHEDSFVNMLASYIKAFEPNLKTYRAKTALGKLTADVDLVVMSPGPGRPVDFNTSAMIEKAVALGIPVFGVCLGLQAVVEYFGGTLGVLDEPRHGVPATVTHDGTGLFADMPQDFSVARYHSLYARDPDLPDCLTVTARAADGVVMGVSHRDLPIHTVQFHPESIITSKNDMGMLLIRNMLQQVDKNG